jgi:Rad3-related DNA helicase
MVGLPYPNKGSPELLEKMKYIESKGKSNGRGSDVRFVNTTPLKRDANTWLGSYCER